MASRRTSPRLNSRETGAVIPKKEIKVKIPWETDNHILGGTATSMSVLLDWLTTDNNYKRCCSKTNKGKSKSSYGADISLIIKEKVEVVRTAKDVTHQIGELERKFREAELPLNVTGGSNTEEDALKDKDQSENFVEKTQKKFIYYIRKWE